MTEVKPKKYKMKTGFCNSGWHEGSKPVSYSGKAAPTCKHFLTCPCECHAVYDQMFKVSGMPRIAVDNSGYKPDYGGFWLPTLDERIAIRLAEQASQVTVIAPTREDLNTPIMKRKFNETPTGQMARGQLEELVLHECNAWLLDPEGFCSPKYIADEIFRERGGESPPSHGAIGAIFDRWVQVGFADCQRKPVRFVQFTEEGRKLGLDALKERAKLKKKRTEVVTTRGTLRRIKKR